jgi:hypothetical protein
MPGDHDSVPSLRDYAALAIAVTRRRLVEGAADFAFVVGSVPMAAIVGLIIAPAFAFLIVAAFLLAPVMTAVYFRRGMLAAIPATDVPTMRASWNASHDPIERIGKTLHDETRRCRCWACIADAQRLRRPEYSRASLLGIMVIVGAGVLTLAVALVVYRLFDFLVTGASAASEMVCDRSWTLCDVVEVTAFRILWLASWFLFVAVAAVVRYLGADTNRHDVQMTLAGPEAPRHHDEQALPSDALDPHDGARTPFSASDTDPAKATADDATDVADIAVARGPAREMDLIRDLAIVGGCHFEAGIREQDAWSARMINELAWKIHEG